MTCPHCGASVSNHERQCPYCNSFLENKTDDIPNSAFETRGQQTRPMFQAQGPDTPQPLLIVLSLMIPFFGIILGVIHTSGGHPKSGKLYIILGALSFFLISCGTFLLPLAFSAFSVFSAFKS